MDKQVDVKKLKEAYDLLCEVCHKLSEAESLIEDGFDGMEGYEHLCGYYSGAITSSHLLLWHVATDLEDDIELKEDETDG